MDIGELQKTLHIKSPIFSLTRMDYHHAGPTELPAGCTLGSVFKKAAEGESVFVTETSSPCPGGRGGFGFNDETPDIPGGFGEFISYGAGEGFRPGERIKCDPEVAHAMISGQPHGVMEGHNAVRIKPYSDDDQADAVAFIVNPDALSVLVHIFNFRTAAYDNVIAPMSSGCASVFRIPFSERINGTHRAVIGNIDISSRPYFDADTFIFVVTNESFQQMLEDAEESILAAPYWKRVEKRLP